MESGFKRRPKDSEPRILGAESLGSETPSLEPLGLGALLPRILELGSMVLRLLWPGDIWRSP